MSPHICCPIQQSPRHFTSAEGHGAYCDRGVDGDDVGFLDEQLTRFVADLSDLSFGNRSTRAQLRDSPSGLGSAYCAGLFSLAHAGRTGRGHS